MIRFRRVVPGDVTLLAAWLDREHVRRWWRDDRAEDQLDPNEHFIVELDGRPVGMIQTYLVDDYPEWKSVVGEERELAGVDLFIGEEDAIGRSVGPQVIRRFVHDVVFARPETRACVATVEEPNRRSWRAFEKAGFRHVLDVEEDGLPHRLMRLDRG